MPSAHDIVPSLPGMKRHGARRAHSRAKVGRRAGAQRGMPWRPSSKIYGDLKIPIKVISKSP